MKNIIFLSMAGWIAFDVLTSTIGVGVRLSGFDSVCEAKGGKVIAGHDGWPHCIRKDAIIEVK